MKTETNEPSLRAYDNALREGERVIAEHSRPEAKMMQAQGCAIARNIPQPTFPPDRVVLPRGK